MNEAKFESTNAGTGKMTIVPSSDRRGLDRRFQFRRISAERRVRRPWVVDIADPRSGRDRRDTHRRSGLDRRTGRLRIRDGGMAMQAMAFVTRQAKAWLGAATAITAAAGFAVMLR